MNLSHLRTFVTLARTHSFRASARINTVSQSAVSQQISALEKKLNKRLIERDKQNIRLTVAGKVFLEYALRTLNDYEAMLSNINQTAKSMTGIIRVCTIYSIGLYRLQPLVQKFIKKYPKVTVHLEYFHNDVVYDRIYNKTCDIGFVAFPKQRTGLSSENFADDEMILVQCVQRPVFNRKTINLSQLNNTPYVGLAQTTPTGRETTRFLRRSDVHPDVINEFENVETLKSAVLIGMGCAIVPRNILKAELKNKSLEVLRVKDLEFNRPLGMLLPQGKVLTRPTETFYNLIARSER